MFVKEAITKTFEGGTNKFLSNCALISVAKESPGDTFVQVVIGAYYALHRGSSFSKKDLEELIFVLQEVHDCMEDK